MSLQLASVMDQASGYMVAGDYGGALALYGTVLAEDPDHDEVCTLTNQQAVSAAVSLFLCRLTRGRGRVIHHRRGAASPKQKRASGSRACRRRRC